MRLSLITSISLLVACSGKSQDLSAVQIDPTPDSAPADGKTAITLSVSAVGPDGMTPYSGSIALTCSKNVLFGNQTQAGVSDTITLVAGAGTDTVTCAPGANCAGPVTIRGTIVNDPNASGTGSVSVTFTAVNGSTTVGTVSGTTTGTVTGTTAGSTGTTGGSTTGSGTGTTGGGSSGTTGVIDAGPPPPANILTSMPQNPYMGIDYQTSATLNPENAFTFEVTDVTKTIPIANVPVVIGISHLSSMPPFVGTLVGAPDGGVDGETLTVVTNPMGLVTVQAHSGQKAGTVTITASVDAGSAVLSATESSQVVGTQPSLTNSTINCSPSNLPVYATGVTLLPCETASKEKYQTVCTVTLADRFGQAIQVPVPVQFFSEAGNFLNTSVSTGDAGQATNILETNGNVPIDVPPYAFEPSYTDTDPGTQRCGLRTYNPRDGLVTIIAVFEGEESFTDLTGSGVYQVGDPFTDMPQPFVDDNDSSVYKMGDICPGSAVAGQCAGPDSFWDANSNVFVETRVVYSGLPGSDIVLGTVDSGFVSNGQTVTNGSTIIFDPITLNIPNMGILNAGVTVADINLNVPASVSLVAGAETAPFTVIGGTLTTYPSGLASTFPAPGYGTTPADTLGMTFTQITECDAGMVETDAGEVPSPVCQLFTHITQFHPGFGTAIQLTNNAQNPGSFTVAGSDNIPGASNAAVAGMSGQAE